MGFFGKRCSLCGGHLNGTVCTECGLDNAKSDKKYRVTEDTHQKHEKLTHVHREGENPFAGKTMPEEWFRKKKKSPVRFFVYFLIFILIMNIGTVLFKMFLEFGSVIVEPSKQPEYEEIVHDEEPYAYVQYELNEWGDEYKNSLESGVYKGGVHIPEGVYRIQYFKEEGQDNEFGYINMNDSANGIFYSVDFEGDGSYIEEYRVYKGGIMEIEGRGHFLFISENAQIADMVNIPNPNLQVYDLRNELVSGEDIVPGVYDVFLLEGSGIFDYSIMAHDQYELYMGKLLGDKESGFPGVLRNIVLPEGTKVTFTDMRVELYPSGAIESEDYDQFYNNY